jgi:pimeloyl-ACP methyl ester carboxylesterase
LIGLAKQPKFAQLIFKIPDPMPTLIRLIVIVLVLVGLGYGGMVALINAVKPKEHEVTLRIPARALLNTPDRTPVVKREINTTRAVAPAATEPVAVEPVAADPAVAPAPSAPAETAPEAVKTLSPGVE